MRQISGGPCPLITTASRKTQSWKDLAEMAKSKGLSGWHSMRKDDLVKALLKAAKKRERLRAMAKSPKATPKPHRREVIAGPHTAHSKTRTPHSNGSKMAASAK